jgi:hypothetical protein
MNEERQTAKLYRQIDAFLRWAGLLKAVKGTPSLIVTILAAVVVMECVAISFPAEYRAMLQPAFFIIGVAVGLISVKGGDYWDRKVFNPRYGLNGKWLNRRPPALFPPGSDLSRYRDIAVQRLKPTGKVNPETGEHVYRESMRILRDYPARFDRATQPNILSKFARNFIFPLFVAAILFLVTFIWKLTTGDNRAALMLAASVLCLAVAVLLFIPYFGFRVEHMIQVYIEAVEALDRKARPSGNAA